MSIDPRLQERRRVVAEARARHSVTRLLKLLTVLAILGAVAWLMLSPIMSVKGVAVAGVGVSNTHAVLDGHDVVPGTPMILIRAGEVETQLEADPWVAEATVRLEWPDRIVVRVVERQPAAWVETDAGWSRRTLDGHTVPSADEPDGTLGWARLQSVSDTNAAESLLVVGAIEFIDNLPEELGGDVIVRVEENGELWALVSGYQVRLGRPVEMREKALSLEALLEVDPPRGAALILIAPAHPAVTPPPSLPESGTRITDPDAGEEQTTVGTIESEGLVEP